MKYELEDNSIYVAIYHTISIMIKYNYYIFIYYYIIFLNIY